MIYLDTSVALAHLLAEDRQLWVRIHARRLAETHSEAARALLGRIAFLELIPEVAGRAREAFPAELRTLGALHLASHLFIAEQGQTVSLAS